MKDKFVKFFKDFSLFDILYLTISLSAVIFVSIFFKSTVLTTIYSIVGILSVFILTKGVFFAPLCLIVMYGLYVVLAYLNGLYGESIIYGAVFIPIQIIAVISWFSKKKKTGDVFVIEKIKVKEWIILLTIASACSVGIYFMLGVFHTKYLILSTITFVLSGIANYLTFRRTEYSFVVYIINNVFFSLLWLMPLIKGGETGNSLIPMAVSSVAFFVINITGLLSWRKMKKEQNQKIQQINEIEE